MPGAMKLASPGIKTELSSVQGRDFPARSSDFFGVQTHFGQRRPDVDEVLGLVARAGAPWIRDEVYWAEVEREKGQFRFPRHHDSYIDAALSRGLRVLLILDYGNPLYLEREKSGPETEEEREAFARYCREVVKRFGPRGVRHYEIWNEPNASTFWQPRPNADDYRKLLGRAFQACKEVDPGCTVIGCSTSGMDGGFIGRVFSSGGGEFMDAVSIHPYCYPLAPERRLGEDIEKLKNIVGPKPIWITEFGYPTHSGAKGVNEEQQANYLTRTFFLAKAASTVERLFWYDFQNDGEDPAEPEFNFGLIKKDKNPKPSYNACRTLLALVRDLPLIESGRKGATFTYRFGEGKEWLIAAWKMDEPELTEIPVSGKRLRIIERDGEAKTLHARDPLLKLMVSEKVRYIVPAD